MTRDYKILYNPVRISSVKSVKSDKTHKIIHSSIYYIIIIIICYGKSYMVSAEKQANTKPDSYLINYI
jgi:hypothetical protein